MRDIYLSIGLEVKRQSPIGNKDGLSRIPRFNRRGSENIEASRFMTSNNFDLPSTTYNQLEADPRNFRHKFKRHSIFEENIPQNSGNINSFSPNNLPLSDSKSFLRCSAVVKRNKSFTEGDRSTTKKQKNTKENVVNRIPMANVLDDELSALSQRPTLMSPRPSLSSKLSRTKSFSTIDMAKKEGVYSSSSTVTYTNLNISSAIPLSSLSRTKSFSSLDPPQNDGILSARLTTHTRAVKDPGRVQVFVRIRPINENEDIGKHPIAVSIEDEECTQLKCFDGKNDRCYQFDGVLSESSDNRETFKQVAEPLVYSALSGFNGILMCYGQTGTGKTHSLMSNDGMTVRIVYKCFKVINFDKKHKYTVMCSYLQIYQDKIFDLLNETRTIELSLREHPKTGVYIENLTEYVVHSPKEVLNLLKVGKQRLVFAETKMNRASSRSHAICQLKILKERVISANNSPNEVSSPSLVKTPDTDDIDDDLYENDPLGGSMNSSYQSLIEDDDDFDDIANQVTDLEDGVTSIRGKMYICDLAGSERIKKTQAAGERLQEAQHINSSLLELGNVIQALAEGNKTHVPFRNSTLTRLLQEGLSGNCKTRLVVCIAPTVKDLHETKCSLNFGSRAMKVQVMAHVNYEVDYKRLAEALAAKLENLEHSWNLQKEDYEKVIAQLKIEVVARRFSLPMNASKLASPSASKQVQALLVVELMTLHLFYNFQQKNLGANSSSLFVPSNQDLVLQCMEGLLELLEDYLCDKSKVNSNYSSCNSSVIMSPDYLESSASTISDLPLTLEPMSRFIEHAQISYANGSNKKFCSLERKKPSCETKERFKRVMNSLLQLKETTNQNAVKQLKETFEVSMKNTGFLDLNRLDDVVALLDKHRDSISSYEHFDDLQALESSLHYLLFDKALLSCILLLKAQSGNFLEGWQSGVPSIDDTKLNVNQIMEELKLEKNTTGKLQEELFILRKEKAAAEEKLKDIELDLQTVRELKEKLENKLCAANDRNLVLEELIEKTQLEKDKLEKRLVDVNMHHSQLEASLKLSDNNNARKERLIVDLKNEKVALDSLLCTLKEELSIMEREKSRENEEKRHIQEELEDVRDRNIILETEWSCCREENGLLENELTALEEDKAFLEEELGKYREDVRMLEEAVSVLEAQASDYKHDIDNLKAKEERLLSCVRSEKEKFAKEINALRQEMSSLRVERRRFQRDISLAKADKSNTERAYTALKGQKESIQEDIASYKQVEKHLQRELAALKSERLKLEREVNNLKTENVKLKQDIVLADKMKSEINILHKNEEKILQMFNFEKDKFIEQLAMFKEKFDELEVNFIKVSTEKERLLKQLNQFENNEHHEACIARRTQSQPTSVASNSSTPDKLKPFSMHGALLRRSIHSGEVSEIEGRVLDLQRRLAFFMAEKEDIQKELITSRERNAKLTSEVRVLEEDTSKFQTLISVLSDEKMAIETRLTELIKSKEVIEQEKELLESTVEVAKNAREKLQIELNNVLEKNQLLEMDQLTINESLRILQKETVVLTAENKHIKQEFEKLDGDLKTTRLVVEDLNKNIANLKEKVLKAQTGEESIKEKLALLESQNASLTDQLNVCQLEEESLFAELKTLNKVFNKILTNFEKNEKEIENDFMEEPMVLRKQLIAELKSKFELIASVAENLKKEREELQALLSDNNSCGSLIENMMSFKTRLVELSEEKLVLEKKLLSVERQLVSNNYQSNQQKDSSSVYQEKIYFKQSIEKLEFQIEEHIREQNQLKSEAEYLKNQNCELRKEIAIILHENTKLENKVEQLESLYIKQESELALAAEKTEELLRQLCATEGRNLDLCTQQYTQQEQLEQSKQLVEKLEKEKLESEEKIKTFKDKLLMAELDISHLRSKATKAESHRQLLVADLDSADRERAILNSELQQLARALSPLKREVTEVIKKQENLNLEQNDANFDITNQVKQMKIELNEYNIEKIALKNEQEELEQRLKLLAFEKDELRSQLRKIIQHFDMQNDESSNTLSNCMEDSISYVSNLLNQQYNMDHEKDLLLEDLHAADYANKILNFCVNNSVEDLQSAHQDLCLATVERLKLKDAERHLTRNINEITNSDRYLSNGLTCLHYEFQKLKVDIESFENEQVCLLEEIRSLNNQLNIAENNVINVVHFKKIIEKNLLQYKERNSQLETHLRVIYEDLLEMELRINGTPSKSAKVLLETIELHRHFQYLEDDLLQSETERKNFKEEAADLMERCNNLQEERTLNMVSTGIVQHSIHDQDNLIAQLQNERDSLVYENKRLETKLSIQKSDRKRIIEDYQRISQNLVGYIKYNNELEKKLEAVKRHYHKKEENTQNNLSASQLNTKQGSDLLCQSCYENVTRNFLGINKNSQILGQELLECIHDNLSIETAIISFIEQKHDLEQQLVAEETQQFYIGNLYNRKPVVSRRESNFSIISRESFFS
ncbi:centromere-associated protein E isoform X3 [Hydra vulgaris]|uniref:centromere-associated protein E isoform X3 n=1 Tax=Hydra vulgaris TaxID=6087 RepID=UPI001F5ECECB|nr:centromere-associated protein E isoform X3 [Hydra vulgaris]